MPVLGDTIRYFVQRGAHYKVAHELAEVMAVVAQGRLSADFGPGTTGVMGLDSLKGKLPGLAYIGLAEAQGKRS